MEGLLSADGEEDAFWHGANSVDCVWDGANACPAITRLLFPDRAAQGTKRNSSAVRHDGGVVRDARGEGMGGVDQKIEIFGLQKLGKSVAAAEAAAQVGTGCAIRLRRASCQRKQAVAIGALRQGGGQLPRFRRAAKDQDAVFAHG